MKHLHSVLPPTQPASGKAPAAKPPKEKPRPIFSRSYTVATDSNRGEQGTPDESGKPRTVVPKLSLADACHFLRGYDQHMERSAAPASGQVAAQKDTPAPQPEPAGDSRFETLCKRLPTGLLTELGIPIPSDHAERKNETQVE